MKYYVQLIALKSEFIDKLPSNVKLTMLIDACHSGTSFDLRYIYNVGNNGGYSVTGNNKVSKANVTMISGCKDSQTSSDAYLYNPDLYKKQYQGAMTASFLSNYKNSMNYLELMKSMGRWLRKNGFSQIPRLSSGKFINPRNKFTLIN